MSADPPEMPTPAEIRDAAREISAYVVFGVVLLGSLGLGALIGSDPATVAVGTGVVWLGHALYRYLRFTHRVRKAGRP